MKELEYLLFWLILNATPLNSFDKEYELVWLYVRDNY